MHYTNSKLFWEPYYGLPPEYLSNPAANLACAANEHFTPASATNRKTCILCLFGVISRGREAWPTIKQRIYDVLVEDGFDVKVFVYNLDIGRQPVDGVRLNHDLTDLPFDYQLESKKQVDVDAYIDAMNAPTASTCTFRGYTQKQSRNALRQMYSENAVGTFLTTHDADIAVVCGPDFYIANDININHIRAAMTCSSVYISQVNPSGGYTNGFYFGKPKNVARIMKRLELYDRTPRVHNTHNYEDYVKFAFKFYQINHKLTDIVFFKVRANGHIRWAGSKQTFFLSEDVKQSVIAEYNRLSSQGPDLVETFEQGFEFDDLYPN